MIETGDGTFTTTAPNDIVQILTESFQIVMAKKIHELTLKVLRVFTNIINQYQNAMNQIYYTKKEQLPTNFLIA